MSFICSNKAHTWIKIKGVEEVLLYFRRRVKPLFLDFCCHEFYSLNYTKCFCNIRDEIVWEKIIPLSPATPPHPPTAWSWTDQTADSDSTQVTQPWAKLCLSFLIWKMAQKQELDQRTVKIKSHVKSTGNYLHYGSPVAGTITIIGALISALITPPSITAMFLQQNAVGLSTLPSTV